MNTIQELQQACTRAHCQVSENESHLILQFPNARVEIRKDFQTGQTQTELFVASGWMPSLRQFLDNK